MLLTFSTPIVFYLLSSPFIIVKEVLGTCNTLDKKSITKELALPFTGCS